MKRIIRAILNGVYTSGNAKEVLEAAEQVLEEYQKKL
jgi:hypothetical protein